MSKKENGIKKFGHPRNVCLILYAEQGGQCYYCKISLLEEAKAGRTPHIDHKIPKSKGGQKSQGWTNLSNLCLTCEWCDTAKNNLTDEQFADFVEPLIMGKLSRKELGEYWLYKQLEKKFENLSVLKS